MKRISVIIIVLLLIALGFVAVLEHTSLANPYGVHASPFNYTPSQNYSQLLAQYETLLTLINTTIPLIHKVLHVMYDRGLYMGISLGLFIGFLSGALIEGIKKRNPKQSS